MYPGKAISKREHHRQRNVLHCSHAAEVMSRLSNHQNALPTHETYPSMGREAVFTSRAFRSSNHVFTATMRGYQSDSRTDRRIDFRGQGVQLMSRPSSIG
jgi:hypothetical protein